MVKAKTIVIGELNKIKRERFRFLVFEFPDSKFDLLNVFLLFLLREISTNHKSKHTQFQDAKQTKEMSYYLPSYTQINAFTQEQYFNFLRQSEEAYYQGKEQVADEVYNQHVSTYENQFKTDYIRNPRLNVVGNLTTVTEDFVRRSVLKHNGPSHFLYY
jgi:hypothetical protein